MNPETQALFDAASVLSEAERTLLVERLLETLSETNEATEEEFVAELARRQAEVEQGLVKPIPWAEVRLS